MFSENDVIFENIAEKKILIRTQNPTKKLDAQSEHNKIKNRPIAAENKQYLYELNITDKDGNVFKNTQDKYKQINHYIDILTPILKGLSTEKPMQLPGQAKACTGGTNRG